VRALQVVRLLPVSRFLGVNARNACRVNPRRGEVGGDVENSINPDGRPRGLTRGVREFG